MDLNVNQIIIFRPLALHFQNFEFTALRDRKINNIYEVSKVCSCRIYIRNNFDFFLKLFSTSKKISTGSPFIFAYFIFKCRFNFMGFVTHISKHFGTQRTEILATFITTSSKSKFQINPVAISETLFLRTVTTRYFFNDTN